MDVLYLWQMAFNPNALTQLLITIQLRKQRTYKIERRPAKKQKVSLNWVFRYLLALLLAMPDFSWRILEAPTAEDSISSEEDSMGDVIGERGRRIGI